MITGVQMCPYRLNTSVWQLVYRCLNTDSRHQSDNLITDIIIQTPYISLTTGVILCASRFHSSVWYIVHRCVHTDYTHHSDTLCTDIFIWNPHISCISGVQISLYRLHISVLQLVYRCLHTESNFSLISCVKLGLHTDSTHQSDNWCTDVSIQTPHFSVISCVQISP
jgi:hypothetical protein